MGLIPFASPSFDAWNRVMSVSRGGSSIQQNAYDGAHRRATKVVSGTLRHYYFSTRWQVLEERFGSASSPDRQFLWSLRHVDNLLLRDRTSERLYALQDANWNITAISSSSGAIAERYVYAGYGQPIFFSAPFTLIGGSAYGWETLFSGYRWESDMQFYFVRHRVMLILLGTFASRDKKHTRQANTYLYASGSPTVRFDPLGLEDTGLPSICIMAGGPGKGCAACHPVQPRSKRPRVNCDYDVRGWMKAKCAAPFGPCRLGAWLHAENCLGLGLAEAHKVPFEGQSAYQHCVALGCLAIRGGCGCAQCMGDSREEYEEACDHQDPRSTKQAGFNNREGRCCAGCLGEDCQSGQYGFLKKTIEDVIACCRKLHDNNELDLGYGQGQEDNWMQHLLQEELE